MEIGLIRPVSIEDEMRDSYLSYAMSVITSRALPDVRDGLKPSQRRILIAMHDLNLAPNRPHRKCAKIAVGMATSIPPHNLSEVVDGLLLLIERPDATVEDLIRLIPGPDFPTGGIILGNEGIRSAYVAGEGKVLVRAKVSIEEPRSGRF